MNIILPQSDQELLLECSIQTMRASGSGGQHVNTTDSSVRLIHLPTKIVVSSQKMRSQYLNKKECIKKLREKVEKLNYKKPKRLATKPSKSTLIKNAFKKKKASEKKRLRSKISEE